MNRLFVDLEGTIISGFKPPLKFTQYVGNISKFITEYNIDEVSILSSAIWDKEEQEIFNRYMKKDIESAIGHKIKEAVAISELGNAMSHVFAKDKLFFKLCTQRYRNDTCFLIDDTVFTDDIFIKTRNLQLFIFNVRRV